MPIEDKPESVETYKARIAELEADLESVRRSQAGSDRAFSVEKKRADALEARIAKGGSEAAILGRLDAIQAGYRKRERDLELTFYKKSKCLDAGIPFELLQDVDLPDEPAIEKKVSQLAAAIEERTTQGVNARLVAGEKPRAAGEPSKFLSRDSTIEKELKTLSSLNGF